MCRKHIVTLLATLSLSASAVAVEFSDANAVSKRLQFIANAVEFGFNLTALELSAVSQEGQPMMGQPVATYEVTSSQPRQLAIGWDGRNNPNMTQPDDNELEVFVAPLRGGPPNNQFKAVFYYAETASGQDLQKVIDGPLRLQVTPAPVQRLAGYIGFYDWFYTGAPGTSPGQPAMVDGTYRLSMVAAVYNP